MEEKDKVFEEKKNKIRIWLGNRYNLIFLGIFIFAFIIRLYYFSLTKSQPLWWDEAVYGSLAKNLALGEPWSHTFLIQNETFIRPMLFPILWATLLKIGFQEIGVRFILQFLPSIIAVVFVYLIGKNLYNERVALLATFIFSTLWVHLFYTARLLTSIPALAFLFPSMYYFIKSQGEEFNAKYFALSLFLLSLSTLIRYPIGLIFFSYLAFILLTKFTLLKNKKFWIYGIIGILPILVFFLLNFISYGNIFPELLSGEYYGKETGVELPIAYNLLNQVPNHLGGGICTIDNLLCYIEKPFFILFIIGAAFLLFELFLGFGLIRKKQKLKSHLFIALLFIIFYSFFIFSARAAEDRYLLPISVTFVLIAGIGGNLLYNAIKKHSRKVAVFIILAIMLFGAYQEVIFADGIIKNKKQSFLYERQGFEWIKENTPEDSVMLGRGTGPYSLYYAERDYLGPPPEKDDEFLKNISADYFIINMYRPPRDYMLLWLQENQEQWTPVHAIFFDAQRQQPAFIVYKYQPTI